MKRQVISINAKNRTATISENHLKPTAEIVDFLDEHLDEFLEFASKAKSWEADILLPENVVFNKSFEKMS